MNEKLFFILFLIILGYFFKQKEIMPANAAYFFNRFILYITLPALILNILHKVDLNQISLLPIILVWFSITLSIVFVLIFSKVLKLNRDIKYGLLLVIPLGNTSFVGIPMIENYFGSDHIIHGIIYDQFGSFFALGSYGSLLSMLYHAKEKINPVIILKKLITFPPFVALILGLVINQKNLWPHITYSLQSLAVLLIPLAMFSVGLQLDIQIKKSELKIIGFGLIFKQIITPIIVLGICVLFNQKQMDAHISVFESGMPPMISATILAIINNMAPKLMANILGIGILFSFLTLPLIHYLIQIFLI